MEKEIIKANQGAEYLSEIMDELPVNCLFNKGKTGCGGTELVLRGKKDAIIAVPYISLIKNKLNANSEHGDRSDEILGFYGMVQEKDVIAYLSTHTLKKIIVTYDSLPKLMEIINKVNGDEEKGYRDYFLLVDEWHCLFKYYIFRYKAIKNMLSIAEKFKEVTYMTATPIIENFILKELKKYPIKEVHWEEKNELRIKLYKTNDPLVMFIEFVKNVCKKEIECNFHVFINSVSMITDLLKQLQLCSQNVKIVCSTNNDDNLEKLQEIDPNYTIAQPDDPAKKLNLYTSTAFEGCDIHDPIGINVIISAAYKDQTMLDVRTTIPQICGRIRDSKYKNTLHYIYSMKKQSKVNFQNYRDACKQEFRENESFIEDLNNLKLENRKKILKLIENTKKNSTIKYIYTDADEKIHLDKNFLKVDIYNYYTTECVFSIPGKLAEEFEKNNNIIVEIKEINWEKDPSIKLAQNPNAKPTNQELFEQYDRLKQSIKTPFSELTFDLFSQSPHEKLAQLEKGRPWIKEAYELLGIDKIKALNYKKIT